MLKDMSSNDKLLIDEVYTKAKASFYDEEKILQDDKGYYYSYNGDKLRIDFLSEGRVRYFDKETLLDKEKRHEMESVRSLRIASSHLLNEAMLLVIFDYEIRSIVVYKKEGEEYVIDYGNNLVMKKRDYDLLFTYQIFETIEQHEMPYLKDALDNLKDVIPPHFIILFYKEIKKSLKGKQKDLFPDKYFAGIHANNRFMLDLGAECLFMIHKEKFDIWEKDADVIYSFTLNPLSRRFPIIATDDGKFIYKDYEFERLSDHINSESHKEELLSSNRYHKCMHRSLDVLFNYPKNKDKSNIHLVLGRIPISEYDSFYHAWVEYKLKKSGTYMVIDYTGNLIMKRDDFIRLRHAEVIRILPYELLNELFSYYDEALIGIDKFPTLFFAEEFLVDYKKNKSLYKNINEER